MDLYLLTKIIRESQKIIPKISGLTRDFKFESNLNYLLTGMRYSGKSFLMYKRAQELVHQGISWKQIIYLNFEDERLADFKLADFNDILIAANTITTEKHYFFFDEIQNVDGWERFARRLADQGERVFITGSNSKTLGQDIISRLGGRYMIKYVSPFSFKEYLRAKNLEFDQIALLNSKNRGEKDSSLTTGGQSQQAGNTTSGTTTDNTGSQSGQAQQGGTTNADQGKTDAGTTNTGADKGNTANTGNTTAGQGNQQTGNTTSGTTTGNTGSQSGQAQQGGTTSADQGKTDAGTTNTGADANKGQQTSDASKDSSKTSTDSKTTADQGKTDTKKDDSKTSTSTTDSAKKDDTKKDDSRASTDKKKDEAKKGDSKSDTSKTNTSKTTDNSKTNDTNSKVDNAIKGIDSVAKSSTDATKSADSRSSDTDKKDGKLRVSLPLGENLVLWSLLNEDAIRLINEYVVSHGLRYKPTDTDMYAERGRVLDLPVISSKDEAEIMKNAKDLKEPHWLPVELVSIDENK